MERTMISGHLSISIGRQPAVLPRNTETALSRNAGAEDANDLILMAEADHDYARGLGGPVEDAFAELHRTSGKHQKAGASTPRRAKVEAR
jgi:hypothetical protein